MRGSANPLTSALVGGGVAQIYRGTLLGSAVAALIALIAGFAFGFPTLGLGAAVGLLLGLANALGMRQMAAKVSAIGGPKRPAVFSSLRRLGLITVAVFALILVSRRLGLAAVVGLGVFQFLLVVSSSRVLLRALREATDA